MNTLDKLKKYFREETALFNLLKIVAVLLIVLLLKMTWQVWMTLISYTFSSLKPFIFGFVIAYVLNPLVNVLEKKGIKKSVAIMLIIIITIVFISWILITLFPMFYDEFTLFLNSLTGSINTISEWYFKTAQNPSEIFTGIINQLETAFTAMQTSALDFVRRVLTNLISTSLNAFTTMLFSITIAIYMLSDFQKFKNRIKSLTSKISLKIPLYLQEIDKEMGTYVRSTLILMLVYFVEYTLIYFILGHKAYLMIGILYVIIGTLVPYIGGMIVTAIGILTGLTLPTTNLIILIILVMIASQVDGYVTSPMIYKKGVKVEPLVSLLLVFVGSALFGVAGVMLSMPVYVAIRAINSVNKQIKLDQKEQLEGVDKDEQII